jgi:hypothetical protein
MKATKITIMLVFAGMVMSAAATGEHTVSSGKLHRTPLGHIACLHHAGYTSEIIQIDENALQPVLRVSPQPTP